MDKQGVLSWPNPSPETVLFFSGRVEPPHSDSQQDLRDDLSVNSFCRMEPDDDRDEGRVCVLSRQEGVDVGGGGFWGCGLFVLHHVRFR